MYYIKLTLLAILINLQGIITGQDINPFKPDFTPPREKKGMRLVWNDEFNINGKPDSAVWIYEKGFIRNEELQWYHSDNVVCKNGVLLIEARREQINNPGYVAGSKRWDLSREIAGYSSGSIQTLGKKHWKFGTFEIRARIDTSKGSWPAIWTMGINGTWPGRGEIDIMEFHLRARAGAQVLRGNVGWLNTGGGAKWDNVLIPLSDFTLKDPEWTKKFHIWKMEWDSVEIKLFLDDFPVNTTSLKETINPDGSNPFLQPHFILLNLAIGSYGGDPSKTVFPVKYEVDYVRIYQIKINK